VVYIAELSTYCITIVIVYLMVSNTNIDIMHNRFRRM